MFKGTFRPGTSYLYILVVQPKSLRPRASWFMYNIFQPSSCIRKPIRDLYTGAYKVDLPIKSINSNLKINRGT